ncbi:hypothetical protein Anapl_04870 [Anas platyrhynchos]|uniref:Uncharacterized protein n=1 Tax=Anas platyrhynchos TaxID=8839 RepID=R0K957_ANAPL|nr:hypothetical protein Anapl_04870 [Anas platyrhynchos]
MTSHGNSPDLFSLINKHLLNVSRCNKSKTVTENCTLNDGFKAATEQEETMKAEWKRNRAHTLVAHHQVRQTLKENKSTVSNEQGSMGRNLINSNIIFMSGYAEIAQDSDNPFTPLAFTKRPLFSVKMIKFSGTGLQRSFITLESTASQVSPGSGDRVFIPVGAWKLQRGTAAVASVPVTKPFSSPHLATSTII